MKDLNTYITEKLKIRKTSHSYKYFPKTKEELQDILKQLIKKRGNDGDFNDIDTSEIIDMSYLFVGMKDLLKIDVSYWDVSNVISTDNMFRGCINLEKIIGIENWDVSNVENMKDMFRGCESFNQDISKWDVSKVTNKSCMFFYCPIEEKYKPKFK